MALKIISIVAIVLGSLAILTGMVDGGEDAIYSFIGGGLFLAQGVMSLDYMKKNPEKEHKCSC